MLSKYGNTMTLIDATCIKPPCMTLHCFFITVKTNAGYTVAAELSYRQRLMNRLKKHLTFGNHGILTGHHNTLCLIIVKQKYWVLSQLFQLLILFHGLFTLSSCR